MAQKRHFVTVNSYKKTSNFQYRFDILLELRLSGVVEQIKEFFG